MAEKQGSIEINKARSIARELAMLLAPGCQRIEIAGSVRRNQVTVHDIDLVAHARYDDQVFNNLWGEPQLVPSGPDALVLEIARVAQIEPPPVDVKILRFTFEGVPVEVYLAERDGSNFDALWQMRTGSTTFNQALASRAKALGLSYRAGHGIYRDGERVDDGTEAGVFAALGLQFVDPVLRVSGLAINSAARVRGQIDG